jgi:hypothetical protein
MQELNNIYSRLLPDIIAITETWLHNEISDAELCLPGMELFRTDRHNRQGGGVALYMRENLKAQDLTPSAFEACPESLWKCIDLHGTKLLLGCIYRPPDSTASNDLLILQALHEAASHANTNLLIIGDFNLKSLMNPNLVRTYSPDSTFTQFRSTLNECVQQPIRIHIGIPTTQLDYVLSDDPNAVSDIRILAPLGLSDHVLILFSYANSSQLSSCKTHRKMNYRNSDYAGMSAFLSQLSWAITGVNDVNMVWTELKNKVSRAIKMFTPFYPPKKKTPKCWLRASTRKHLLKKRRAWDRFSLVQSPSSYEQYAKLRNIANSHVRQDKCYFQSKLRHQAKSNPKSFFKYMNGLSKVKPHIPNLSINGTLTHTPEEVPNTLATQFSSVVANSSPNSAIPYIPMPTGPNNLGLPNFSEEKVKYVLRKLDPRKSGGLDDIPAIVLRQLSDVLALPLSILFSLSYSTSTFPDDWKRCQILPRFKGGSRSSLQNYRPITMLPIGSKVMESIVAEELDSLLFQSNLLHENQHGFRKGRSCVTNLLCAADAWTMFADDCTPVDVVYLDFAKAFDTVDHSIIIRKLSTL